jgi:hypothetical protein
MRICRRPACSRITTLQKASVMPVGAHS